MDETLSLEIALDLIGEKYLRLKPESRSSLMECARIEVFTTIV